MRSRKAAVGREMEGSDEILSDEILKVVSYKSCISSRALQVVDVVILSDRVSGRGFNRGSNRVLAGFSSSDADGFLDIGHEDLAVADPPGLGRAADRVDRALD